MRTGCVGLGHIGQSCGTDLCAPGSPETLAEYLAAMPRAQREADRQAD